MIIEQTADPKLIKSLIKPYWGVAVADNEDFELFEPRIDQFNGWLIVKDKCDIIGIIYAEQVSTVAVKMHPYLSGEKGRGREMIKTALKYFYKLETVNKVNVCIPEIYPAIYNAAKKIGFKDEGVDRESYLKNGSFHDQNLLGLTRKEIEVLAWDLQQA